MTAHVARADLLTSINLVMREISGLSVLHSQAMATALGINSTDLECLDIVLVRGRVKAGDLADLTGLTTGAITGVLDRLETAGFVRRIRDTEDRRKVFVEVPAAVRKRGNHLGLPMQEAMLRVLGTYGDAQLAIFLDILSSLQREAMGAIKIVREKAEKTHAKRK